MIYLLCFVAWWMFGFFVARLTFPRWIGAPIWWVALLWPFAFRRVP